MFLTWLFHCSTAYIDLNSQGPTREVLSTQAGDQDSNMRPLGLNQALPTNTDIKILVIRQDFLRPIHQ